MRVLSVANQKGGVTKTTTAVMVAGYLAAAGQRVLMLDLDPQGNATLALGVSPPDLGMLDLFTDHDLGMDAVLVRAWDNLDLVPCDIRLSTLEIAAAMGEAPIPLTMVRDKLRQLRTRYDYVVCDTPPSLGAFTLNALAVSDRVLVPIDGGNPFAVIGFKLLLNSLRQIQQQFNPKLRPLGFFRTKWDERLVLCRQMWAALTAEYPHMALDSLVPENVKLPQAMAAGQHIMVHDPNATGAAAFLRLTEEVVAKWEGARW